MKIAVYGCGNMASALINGIYQFNNDLEIHTFTPSFKRAELLATLVKGKAHKEVQTIPLCDFYLIACKPQQVEELSIMLADVLPDESNIISILAGTTVDKLKNLFRSQKIIRVMPNTPCLVGEGVNLVYSSPEVNESEKTYITEQLSLVSTVFTLKKESEIDDYVGISGSGPAYIFEISRILSAKAESLGLKKEDANLMANKMIFGSAKLLMNSEQDPETLRNNVTSKAGVTYEALETLKEFKLEEAFNKALNRATKRSIELG